MKNKYPIPIEVIYGLSLTLFYGIMIVSSFIHDDIVFPNGTREQLITINPFLQALAALSILVAPLHRKLFGLVGTLSALAAFFIIMLLFDHTLIDRFFGGSYVFLLLLAPSAYIWWSAKRGPHPTNRFSFPHLLIMSLSGFWFFWLLDLLRIG